MKTLTRLTLAVALLVPVGAVAAGPAAAAGGTSCKTQIGAGTVTPGAGTTNKAQTLSVTTAIGGCVGGGVTKGTGKSVVKLKPVNCSVLAKTGIKSPLTETITWNTTKTSTLVGTATLGPKVGQATLALKVTKGVFVGMHASTVVSFAIAQKAPFCTDAHPLKKLSLKQVKPFVIKA